MLDSGPNARSVPDSLIVLLHFHRATTRFWFVGLHRFALDLGINSRLEYYDAKLLTDKSSALLEILKTPN